MNPLNGNDHCQWLGQQMAQVNNLWQAGKLTRIEMSTHMNALKAQAPSEKILARMEKIHAAMFTSKKTSLKQRVSVAAKHRRAVRARIMRCAPPLSPMLIG